MSTASFKTSRLKSNNGHTGSLVRSMRGKAHTACRLKNRSSLSTAEYSRLGVPYGLLTANVIPAFGLFGFACMSGHYVPFCGGWLMGFIAASICAGIAFSQQIRQHKKSQADALALPSPAATIDATISDDLRSNLSSTPTVSCDDRSKAG